MSKLNKDNIMREIMLYRAMDKVKELFIPDFSVEEQYREEAIRVKLTHYLVDLLEKQKEAIELLERLSRCYIDIPAKYININLYNDVFEFLRENNK